MISEKSNSKPKSKLLAIAAILTVFIALAAFESYSASASSALASTINLPQTGQTSCHDASGNTIACAGTRQDGDIKAGVAWPNPRFTENGDQTITDKLTGLVWAKDAGTPSVGSCTGGAMAWTNALDYVTCLNTANYLGHNDWRLPNINELESLVNAQQSNTATWLGTQGYANVQSNYYWSSTTHAASTSSAWDVTMWDGGVYDHDKSNSYYVWPVRAGQSGSFGNSAIWATGQTQSYHSGDDGTMKAGAVWLNPRFIDNGDGTVTDNLTGLMWTKNANRAAGTKTWQRALDDIVSMNNGSGTYGHTDWRLPNRKELRSLADYSKFNPALPAENPYANVQSDLYWSSTTNANNKFYAWSVGVWNCDVESKDKSDGYYVWPVRAGQVANSTPTPTPTPTPTSTPAPTPTPTPSTRVDKAIIVAGGGSDSSNWLWGSTATTADNAYIALTNQGFTKDKDRIKYLSADTENKNVTDVATKDNLKNILKTWAPDANDLVIYFTDHGGDGTFKIGGTETLNAADFKNWINDLQTKISGMIIFVYDACESQSFISYLTPPEGKQRILISSAGSDQQAYFIVNGVISFSNYFWTQVLNGANIYYAFVAAKQATEIGAGASGGKYNQEPRIDDNSNGICNEKDDGDLAKTKHIGTGTALGASVPKITSASPDPQTLSGTSSAKIIVNVADIISTESVDKVWANIIPPEYSTGSSAVPVIDLPTVELTYVSAGKRYEGTYNQFTTLGDYKVAVYLTDTKGNISTPASATVTQTDSSASNPKPAITVNGSNASSVDLTTAGTITLAVSLDPGTGSVKNADLWLYAYTPYGTFYFDSSAGWKSGYKVTYSGELFKLPSTTVLTLPLNGLQSGNYLFIFEVDTNPNGKRDGDIYTSSVGVNVK
ncbi:MAG: DUF1566 domain-containing protein [Nitrospirae bacterium]|nr:DUF1566 domain-containing protein [Nitrospirota bacterium]